MFSKPPAIEIPLRTDEHGKIRVGNSNVLLELVIYAYQQGETAEGILNQYPTLILSDVYAVITYYLVNQTEIQNYLDESELKITQIQRDVEASYSTETKQLLARLRSVRDEQSS